MSTSLTTEATLDSDSIMWLASCTKIATSICAMQCVERGLVQLDDDLRMIVPEMDVAEIIRSNGLGGFSDLIPNSRPITLRQLLSHTSGYGYEFLAPQLQQWRKTQSQKRLSGSVLGRYDHPLLFEPGTSWSYGPSLDWAGIVVERLTGSNLEDYMRHNIWEPLGIKDMTFNLSTRPDLLTRRAWMSWRDAGSESVQAASSAERNPSFQHELEGAHGGGGLFSTPRDFFEIILALLRATEGPQTAGRTTGPRLLQSSTANLMFEPQLGNDAKHALMRFSSSPAINHMMSNMPLGVDKDHGLGGILLLEDLPGWRRKGTMTWGGTPNLTWFIDRTAGLCGLYASQLMPIGDPKTNELLHLFEKTMYRCYGKLQAAQDTSNTSDTPHSRSQ